MKKTLDHLQTHILYELGFSFSIIGITKTHITDINTDNFNYITPEYSFEFVPTPLAAGGVRMYINNELRYFIIEKTVSKDFQALWIEILLPNKKNIIYKLEYFTSLCKTVVAMGDFLLISQSCSMTPSIDKPTRVHRDSATLIDNLFVNIPDEILISGNIVSDVSDHFSQLCIIDSISAKNNITKFKIRDYSRCSETLFLQDLITNRLELHNNRPWTQS